MNAVPDPKATPLLTIKETAALLRISKSNAYELAARDELPVKVRRVGGNLRVPTRPLLDAMGLLSA